MKAIVYTKYGPPDVLHIEEVERPITKEDGVLVRVHAASVNAADWHLLTADDFFVCLFNGMFKPKRTILGADIAGRSGFFHLYCLWPQWMDGAESVLDAGGAFTYGYYGEILYVLWAGFYYSQRIGQYRCCKVKRRINNG